MEKAILEKHKIVWNVSKHSDKSLCVRRLHSQQKIEEFALDKAS